MIIEEEIKDYIEIQLRLFEEKMVNVSVTSRINYIFISKLFFIRII